MNQKKEKRLKIRSCLTGAIFPAGRGMELKCSSFTRRYAEVLPMPRMKKQWCLIQ